MLFFKKKKYIFFSGMAAINAVLETLQSGDHVIASDKVKYFEFLSLL